MPLTRLQNALRLLKIVFLLFSIDIKSIFQFLFSIRKWYIDIIWNKLLVSSKTKKVTLFRYNTILIAIIDDQRCLLSLELNIFLIRNKRIWNQWLKIPFSYPSLYYTPYLFLVINWNANIIMTCYIKKLL